MLSEKMRFLDRWEIDAWVLLQESRQGRRAAARRTHYENESVEIVDGDHLAHAPALTQPITKNAKGAKAKPSTRAPDIGENAFFSAQVNSG